MSAYGGVGVRQCGRTAVRPYRSRPTLLQTAVKPGAGRHRRRVEGQRQLERGPPRAIAIRARTSRLNTDPAGRLALAAGSVWEGKGGACAALRWSGTTGSSRGLEPVCCGLRQGSRIGFIALTSLHQLCSFSNNSGNVVAGDRTETRAAPVKPTPCVRQLASAGILCHETLTHPIWTGNGTIPGPE